MFVESKKPKTQLKFYNSCKHPPLPIFVDQFGTPFLYIYPPPLLHILLGVVNDALKTMGKEWEDEMKAFFKDGDHERKRGKVLSIEGYPSSRRA